MQRIHYAIGCLKKLQAGKLINYLNDYLGRANIVEPRPTVPLPEGTGIYENPVHETNPEDHLVFAKPVPPRDYGKGDLGLKGEDTRQRNAIKRMFDAETISPELHTTVKEAFKYDPEKCELSKQWLNLESKDERNQFLREHGGKLSKRRLPSGEQHALEVVGADQRHAPTQGEMARPHQKRIEELEAKLAKEGKTSFQYGGRITTRI